MTLATLSMVRDKLPGLWLCFLGGDQSWKTIIIPLMLGGLCYVIGVIYEAADYSPMMRWLVLGSDHRAFAQAWAELCGDGELLESKTIQEIKCFRFQLWDTLVFKGGLAVGMSLVFAHCHRFQAEHKMFLHLIYPSLLFALCSFAYCFPIRGLVGLGISLLLFFLSHSRNRRRWLQTIIFCKQLDGLVEACARSCFGESNPNSSGTWEETSAASLGEK